MYNGRLHLLLALFLAGATVNAQEISIDRSSVGRMQRDMAFLASEALAGRAPGTPGIDQAKNYITDKMTNAGLAPMGESGFSQAFPFPSGVVADAANTTVTFGKKSLVLSHDFYPVAQSSNGRATGKTLFVGYGIEGEERNDFKGLNLEGRVAVLNVSSPDGIHPHSAYAKYHNLTERLKKLVEKGAVAVLLINPEKTATDASESFNFIKAVGVPVVFVRNEKLSKRLQRAKKRVTVSVAQEETYGEGYNLIGYRDNGAEHTVVIGAHYDHLGMGGSSSLYAGPAEVHNGADDNGSGTVLFLELMNKLSTPQFAGYNYLFIAFSAEEMGLIGSKYYVSKPTFPNEMVHYMINLDMVGRMREHRVQISGTGTAVQWDALIDGLESPLEIKKDPSGIGPSDQTSFYKADIPVLHFFTGTHEDYHKPTDDVDKINFVGMELLSVYIQNLILDTQELPELKFQRTKSNQGKKAASFSVTLGIMPDYMFGGPGVKLDGVVEGKTASVAGLKTGDIVLQLGDYVIDDIYGYMNALAAFKPGDEVTVTYLRDGKTLTTKATF